MRPVEGVTKAQLSFNVRVFALGLDLTKEGYDSIAGAARRDMTMPELHSHLRLLVISHEAPIKEENVIKSFEFQQKKFEHHPTRWSQQN